MRKTLSIIVLSVFILCFFIGCTFSPATLPDVPDENIEDNTTPESEMPNKLSQDELRARDERFLNSYREMTIDEDFKDDTVCVTFKYTYTGNLGLKYFDKLSVDTEVISIYDFHKTISKGSDDTISMANRDYRNVILTLNTHDKNIVLEAAKEIMSWDEVLIASLKRTFNFAKYENHNKLSPDELKAQDEMILHYYYEMTLDNEFKDNIIVVVFKYTYTGNLGLKYFDKLSVDTEVISISDSLTRKTVTKESQGFSSSCIIMSNRNSRLVTLTLSTHDKNIVLQAAKEIMSWDEVLTAMPYPILYVHYDV